LTFTPLLLAPVIPPGLVTFLPFVLIIAVFYLMLVRPNQKKQKQWQEMLGALKSGDRITTTGGMRGTIISIKEDAVQLRVPPEPAVKAAEQIKFKPALHEGQPIDSLAQVHIIFELIS